MSAIELRSQLGGVARSLRKCCSMRLFALGLFLFACGDEPAAPPSGDGAPIVRPERVEALTSFVERVSLPDGLRSDAALTVSVLDGTGTLVGGAAGLFQLSGSDLISIDPVPVTALADVAGTGIVVGGSAGVYVWNGTLIESPLTEAIEAMSVTSLLEKAGVLFVGTEDALYLLEAGELFQFGSIGASQLAGYAAGRSLVIDEHILLQDGWSLQDLGDEIAAEKMIPAAGDRLFAADG